jgi:aminoglycoside phosphotransferase family enzyme/predicted kinase
VQETVIEFLKSPSGHPGGGQVDVVQTHGALIFLAGDVALKIKRSVKYDYMDLSTLDLREKMLRRELALNKPIAPEIYRDVVAVTRSADGSLAIDGEGPPVEWVLRMWRFPAKAELAVIAKAGRIGDTLADDLGGAIFAFHDQAPQRRCDGARLIRDILDELDRAFTDMVDVLGASLIAGFRVKSHAALDQIAPLLKRRGDTGHVRRCHGDLHLGNLVLLDGKPVPFDALEFDEVLGTCDVLYDLAYLIMDLWHRDLDRAANMVLNAYLLAASGGEDEGLAALPLFIAIRAAVRAMVLVQTATATGSDANPEAVRYLNDALAVLPPPAASLVLVGGMSGTGKTTVSRALAPLIGAAPGAIHLRSDVERKAMRGTDAQARLASKDYDPAARFAVYDRLFNRASAILAAGHSVLIDATFLDAETRRTARRLAQTVGVRLHPLWLDTPLPDLIDRVRARVGDASDADERVVRHQFKADTAPTDWQVISAAGLTSKTIARAKTALHLPADE